MSEGIQLSAFVMMPYQDQFLELYTSSISPILESHNLVSYLAPDVHASRDTMSNIYLGIWHSRLVVTDLTGLNANVLYELGIALGLNKQAILITQNIDEVPFDLRRDKLISYTNSSTGRNKLRNDLSKELAPILRNDIWNYPPSWKEGIYAEILPVEALLEIESRVKNETWIIEPEESFQDEVFYQVTDFSVPWFQQVLAPISR